MNDLYNFGSKHGTDKITHHGYQYSYPKYLEGLRSEEFNMLEIGYLGGHSCRMWEEYFPKAKVFAMDINVEGQFDKHTVFKGDQSKADDLKRVAGQIGQARFIIDDGSHHPLHQIDTFNILFKNLLEPGGVYIIEDIECNYWKEESNIYGYTIGVFNAVDYTKKLIENVNGEFSRRENKLDISSISYSQNCIIITKKTEEEKKYFKREYRYSANI